MSDAQGRARGRPGGGAARRLCDVNARRSPPVTRRRHAVRGIVGHGRVGGGGTGIETAVAIEDLDPDGDGVYVRRYEDGMVLVNPSSPWDGTAATRTVDLGRTFELVLASGGGPLPPSGVPTSSLTYETVTSVTLPPYSAAIVLGSAPAGPRCDGEPATIVGTVGPDTLRGTDGRDVIAGLAGDDVLAGLDGRDLVCGRAGDDRLSGGRGTDVLAGGGGYDVCRPGPGGGVERSCERVRR